MFQKKLAVGLSVLILGVVLTACGSNTTTETETSEPGRMEQESSITQVSDIIKESGVETSESDEPEESGTQSKEETVAIEQSEKAVQEYELPEEGEGGRILASGTSIAAPEGTQCISLSEEPNAEFLFSSGVALRNLQFVSLSFDGERYKREAFIHTIYDFPAETVIKVSTYIPELYSNLLLQYEDPTGAFHSFFVLYDMSADQPTVALKDAMDTEIEW